MPTRILHYDFDIKIEKGPDFMHQPKKIVFYRQNSLHPFKKFHHQKKNFSNKKNYK